MSEYSLIIEPSDFSPKIYLNPSENKFEISGESRPENTSKFYSQLISWIDSLKAFLKVNPSSNKLIFEFRFEYFNSTSAKFILDFLQNLETVKNQNAGIEIIIRWHYDKRDEDMHDSGEEFSFLIKLPFELVGH